MSDILTRDEYAGIAAETSFPSNAWINGKYTAARSGETFETVNPATGEVLAQMASCGAEDVDYAVKKGKQAFEAGVWSRLHPSERKDIMIKWVKRLKRNRYELAVLESLESGKPVSDCATIDLEETIACLAWYAESADKIYGRTSPSGDDAIGMIVREPVGVAACVLPWNFPMLMMAWKVGPALAAGCSVVVKPAEQTSMTALRLAELAKEAGMPDGVLNVVTGLGETAGQAIGMHPDIDVISFTGSTEIGRLFLKYAADSNLKKVILECGGKNPAVVLSDAEHLDAVAEHVVTACFWNMGQNCTSNSRLIVHKDVKEALVEKVLVKVREWRTGDPLEPSSRLGSLVSQEHFDKVMSYVAAGKKGGAKLLLGGEPLKVGSGLFLPPTIFDDVTPEMVIAKEEIFGPVLAIITAGSDEEAMKIANDTCYGLQASLFTSNLRKAMRGARELNAGTVSVNCYGEGDVTTPFGGMKLSGFGGRDNGMDAFEQYVETKTIWVDLSDFEVDADLE
ncbi:MAG: aldehyde dehydrogenase [Akkermansiaceae bacterium]|jgi:gamma-glutamyl-gamma-aminobutyraldehyde dehydrogenase|nr:aldehyde dehydrogenase [Akkermansiaceae bacterium]